jgi:ketosteroid isomerase-like protein
VSNPPAFPVRGSYYGHEGVRQWRADVFDVIDDVNVEAEKLFDAGDGETVVMFLRLRGVGIYTRIPIDETWAAVWTIRDGKLVHAQGYISRRKALEAAVTRPTRCGVRGPFTSTVRLVAWATSNTVAPGGGPTIRSTSSEAPTTSLGPPARQSSAT